MPGGRRSESFVTPEPDLSAVSPYPDHYSVELLRDLLEDRCNRYNRPHFIAEDPIALPHRFHRREDIEIAGFFAATLAWGRRSTILASGRRLLFLMDDAPSDFIRLASPRELERLSTFTHRTFNGTDTRFFVLALRRLYLEEGGLSGFMARHCPTDVPDTGIALAALHAWFFAQPDAPTRSRRHLSDPSRGSAAKRLSMFLRWMVRRDDRGVDFGLWLAPSPQQLICPLDVHTARISRHLGLLHRKSNDWKAAQELTASLRQFDALDPVRFDFALFGLGVYERGIFL